MAPWISLSSSACRAGPVLFVLVEGVQFAALGPWAQLVRIEADKLPLQFLNYDRAHLQSLTQFAYGPGDDTRVAGADVLEGYQHPHLRRSPLFPYVPNQRQSRPSPQSWEVAGCATGSARHLSAHNWGGLQSLYFGLFLYQVHIVASVASASRPLLLTLNFGELRQSEVHPQIIPTASSADRVDPGHRAGVLRGLIQDPANELRRILLLGTWMNKPPGNAPDASGWHHGCCGQPVGEEPGWQGGGGKLPEASLSRRGRRLEDRVRSDSNLHSRPLSPPAIRYGGEYRARLPPNVGAAARG